MRYTLQKEIDEDSLCEFEFGRDVWGVVLIDEVYLRSWKNEWMDSPQEGVGTTKKNCSYILQGYFDVLPTKIKNSYKHYILYCWLNETAN